jgi:hypothetical protein
MCERYVTSCSGRQRRDGMSAWLSRPARLCVCRLPLSASALARMEEQDGADAGHPGRRAAPPVLGPVCEELDERHPSCSNLHGPREESDERHLSGPNPRGPGRCRQSSQGVEVGRCCCPSRNSLSDQINHCQLLPGLPFRIVN